MLAGLLVLMKLPNDEEIVKQPSRHKSVVLVWQQLSYFWCRNNAEKLIHWSADGFSLRQMLQHYVSTTQSDTSYVWQALQAVQLGVPYICLIYLEPHYLSIIPTACKGTSLIDAGSTLNSERQCDITLKGTRAAFHSQEGSPEQSGRSDLILQPHFQQPVRGYPERCCRRAADHAQEAIRPLQHLAQVRRLLAPCQIRSHHISSSHTRLIR